MYEYEYDKNEGTQLRRILYYSHVKTYHMFVSFSSFKHIESE